MTGYEFEDYISNLLKNMGFSITKTPYSNDGGIDLLATYEKPVFSGKYIIQCKNYTGLVGQPDVRDLYGVIMSENANKGILITPSNFTEQAYSFAKGKNIELINGDVLNKLIEEYGGGTTAAKSFESSGFNREQYNYLMQCIDNDPSDPKFYLQAIGFLRNSIIDDEPFVQAENLFDKIIDLNMRLIKRCYKNKTDLNFRKACWYRIAEVEIIRGNLGAATNILLDNNWFYIKQWLPSWRTILASVDSVNTRHIFEPYYECTLAKNLYSALKNINHKQASSEIIRMIDINAEIEAKHQKPTYIYGSADERTAIDEIIKKSGEEYYPFKFGKPRHWFIYSSPKPDKKFFRYQKSSLDIKKPVDQMKKYYSKPENVIIEEVNMAFRQHGIALGENNLRGE